MPLCEALVPVMLVRFDTEQECQLRIDGHARHRAAMPERNSRPAA